jgi:hypothetical protein
MLLTAWDRAIRLVVRQDGSLSKQALKAGLSEQMQQLGVPSDQAEAVQSFLEDKGWYDAVVETVQQNGEVFGAYKTVGQGGIPERVLAAFLGSAKTGILAGDPHVQEQLELLHAKKSVLVASSWSAAPGPEFQGPEGSWWVGNHAYSVLDYEPASRIVTLRNPWGSHPPPDGVTVLPLATFLRGFQIYFHAGVPGN